MSHAPGGTTTGDAHVELIAALQHVPELAGRALTLTPLSGGITNRNYRVDVEGTSDRFVIRLAGNDTHLLGISREVEHAATVAAAGVGVGAEVIAFLRPEGILVSRFIEGTSVADLDIHAPSVIERVADSVRRFHDGPAIPGLFVPLRVVEAYRALARDNGVPIPAEYARRLCDLPPDRARPGHAADRAPAVPQRLPARQPDRRRRRGSGSWTGSTPGWATRSSTSATSASTTS